MQALPDPLHYAKVIRKVVDRVQSRRQRLARLHQMAKIRARVAPAYGATALRIRRALVFRIALGLDVQPPFACKQQSVPRRPCRQHAIHHVDAHPRVLFNLVGITNAHHVARLVFGQQRQHLGNHLQRQRARFTHAQAANRVAVKLHLHQPLRAGLAEVRIHPSLHNPKQILRLPAQFLAPHHFIAMSLEVVQRSPRPRHRQPQALLCAAAFRRVFRALVKGHRNVGPERNLHVHRVFGSKEVAASIQVRTEPHAFVRHLAQRCQRKHLESARIRQHRPRPTDELVQTAKSPNQLVTGPQIEMIGIAENDLGAQRLQNILGNCLHRASRAHRHKHRRLHGPVRQR